MAKSIPALINPAMLTWARESARLTIEQAAQKIGIAADKLAACEANEAKLTFPQLMKAAREYKRPVSLFYLDAPPAGWQPIQDLRRLAGIERGFSPKPAFVIRQARERRELALELRAELNEPATPFMMTATTGSDAETLGAAIRQHLGVTDSQQQQWKRRAFESWRLAMEAKDVLVFRVPRLSLAEMRGVAIAWRDLPVILVNAPDRTGGRVFTLLRT